MRAKRQVRWGTALSVLGNGLALAWLAWGWWAAPALPPAPVAAPALKPAAAPAKPSPRQQPAFHWAQVESEDYAAFIGNLRRIGCPESTIRDIVQGELRTSYGERCAQLEKEILRSPTYQPPAGKTRQQVLETRMRQVESEMNALTGSLMAQGSAPAVATSAAYASAVAVGPGIANGVTNGVATSAASTAAAVAPPVRKPLVLAGVDLTAAPAAAPGTTRPTYAGPGMMAVTPEQSAALGEMQEKFVADIGGPGQDPADPAYARRWRQAQTAADDLYRLRYGVDAFNDMSRAAAQKAYNEARAAGQK
ncbi:MAG: hypothetical protein ACOYMN_07945 [Roseimicrobium sp.]